MHTLPADVLPSEEALQEGYSHLPSDIMVPVISAMNDNTRKIIDQQKDDSNRRHEAVKDLIKASEERAVQRALTDGLGRKRVEPDPRSTSNSERAKSRSEKVIGLDVICSDSKMAWATSLWCCA